MKCYTDCPICKAGSPTYTITIRHSGGNETSLHQAISTRVLNKWFPEISERFWNHSFEVQSMTMVMATPEGDTAIWNITRNEA